MKRPNNLFLILHLFLLLHFTSCKENIEYVNTLSGSEALNDGNKYITEVMIHDIFSPPVASRIYAYPNIAAYEIAVMADPKYKSLMGQLNGFEPTDFDIPDEIHFPLASITAFYEVGLQLVFSEDKLIEKRDLIYSDIKKKGIPDQTYNNSIKLGKAVADHVMAYAKKDNYHQSRSFEKHTIRKEEGTWQPTPPIYMEGIEPHWRTIRPFFLDSAAQFKSVPPTTFSKEKNSPFYNEALEVFNITNNLTKEQTDIAMFWDCNPYKMNVKGHVMFAEKKITPGGHWMGIASIAAKASNLDWKNTAEAMAFTGLAIMDGFIACWDEKYRSVLIRPETYINQHIDEDWLPLLQTPPFPEYTSGHSVISTAASKALTHLFGEPFHIVDSTETAYGLPVREFSSFKSAAAEAAISRLYGGIHYMPAIIHGQTKGAKVGDLLISKVKTRNDNLAEK
ncbi:phosphatidic acid phosphatase [Anditalea andensis]|uniref:Phosphatidic acid phosphatase n=2 Tax=Anditalea andensis TaxID=1048983 RepID=A0A074L1N2_9BACT|nr:phosphatidic acid phosphatase [Anditalea andensis]